MKIEVDHSFNLQSRKEKAQNQWKKGKKKNIQNKLYEAKGVNSYQITQLYSRS